MSDFIRHQTTPEKKRRVHSWKPTIVRNRFAWPRRDLSEKLKRSPMAKAGDQYDVRTGNIWSHCRRDDVRAVTRLLNEGVDLELRNKVPLSPLLTLTAAFSHRCSLSPLLTLVEYRPSH